jgi:hypothetical protein
MVRWEHTGSDEEEPGGDVDADLPITRSFKKIDTDRRETTVR